MNNFTVIISSSLITFILGIVTSRKKWARMFKVAKELFDVAAKIDVALEDDKISPEELKAILKEVRDVLKLLEKNHTG